MRKIFLILSVGCIVSESFGQTEVSITATKDNTLYSEGGNLSNGAGIYFFAGKTNSGNTRRALVQFDLTGKIPLNATITSAKLKLNMSKSNAAAINIKLQKALVSWGEGTSDALGNDGNEGSGAVATINDATWVNRFFNTSNWTNQGGDFSSTVSTQISVSGIGSYEFISTSQTVADVQGWLIDPGSNNGWVIIGGENANATAKRFDSRENATAANRPTLTVTYTTSTSVEQNTSNPNRFSLEQNYPNPFNPSTVIRYSIPVSEHVSLKVFDLLGKEIAILVNETKAAGSFSQEWDASGLPSGIYFYRLQSGNNVSTKKLLLTK